MTPSERPAPKLLLGRYRLVRQLAHGGAGTIWEAFDEGLGRQVALKRSTDRSEAADARFAREFRWLSSLHHPAIIRAHDYAVDDDGPFYTMELLDGRDVNERVPLDVESVCRHLRDLASALALLHARGLVYRDLSARNVRITSDGRAKLLDFGAVAEGGVQEAIIATPPYTAPECLNTHHLDGRSDLYALGALGYYLLTKQHAYPAGSLEDLLERWEEPPPPPSAFVPWVPPALDELLLSLLHQDVLARPPCAAAVIERLDAIASLPPERDLAVARSYFQSPVLVGREVELQAFGDALTRTHGGEGGTLHLEATAGLGKSRLLDRLRTESQIAGATVVVVEGARGPQVQLGEALGRALEVVWPGESVAGDRMDTMLDALLRRVRSRTLVVLIDDLHLLEEGSLALLGALTAAAPHSRLLIVTTRRADIAPSANLARLLRGGASLRLSTLSPSRSRELVGMLFGRASHLERWSRALHDATGGNPLHLLSIAVELMRSDVARYENGEWTLPPQVQLPLGADLWASLRARLATLSAEARGLAEALSVFTDAPSVSLCARVWPLDGEALGRALQELQAEGVLLPRGDAQLCFAQTSVRECLYRELREAHRRELHARAAVALGTDGAAPLEPGQQLEVGWHWLRAGEREKGARLLEQAGVSLAMNGKQLPIVVPALEAALRVYRELDYPFTRQLRLITALLGSAYPYGPELVTRYAGDALPAMRRLSGMTFAARASRWVGAGPGLLLGIAISLLRRLLNPVQRRSHTVREGLAAVWGSWATCMAVGAVTQNLELQERTLADLSLSHGFPPRSLLGLMYRHCRSGYWLAHGCDGRAHEDWTAVLGPLSREGGVRGLPEDVRVQFLSVVLSGLGQVAALTNGRTSLDYVARLRELDLEIAQPLAWYVQLIHHAYRGESERAEAARRGLEMSNACVVSTWRQDASIPVWMCGACFLTRDALALKRAAEQLHEMSQRIPTLGPASDAARAAYLSVRGRRGEAIELYRAVLGDITTRRFPRWGLVVAQLAETLNEEGQHDEAQALCERAVAQLEPSDRRFVLQTQALERQLALAQCKQGQVDAALARLSRLQSESEDGDNPLLLALLHRDLARVFAHRRDRGSTEAHLAAMERWAERTRNPALRAQVAQQRMEPSHRFVEPVSHVRAIEVASSEPPSSASKCDPRR